MRILVLGLALLLTLTTPVEGAVILLEEFGTGLPSPYLVDTSTSAAYSVAYDGDWAIFERTGTTDEGRAHLVTPFNVEGDFTAVTVVRRQELGTNGALGLVAWYSQSAPYEFASIFFEGNGAINSSTQGFGSGGIVSSSASDAWFRIRRVGETIYLEYFEGTSPTYPENLFQQLYVLTAPGLGDPAAIGLFLYNPQGEGDRRGSFDILAIDVPVPEVGTLLIVATGLLLTLAGKRRQRTL